MVAAPAVKEKLSCIRVLPAPDRGYDAWQQMWDKLDFTSQTRLTDEQKGTLEAKVAGTLSQLESEDYASFCMHARGCAKTQDMYHHPGYIFSDLPIMADFRKRYEPQSTFFREKGRRMDDKQDSLFALGGLAAFAVGAVEAGVAGEYLGNTARLKNVADALHYPSLAAHAERLVTAAGAVVAGMVGIGVVYAVINIYKHRIDAQETKVEEKMNREFISQVQEYIQRHKPA